MKKSVSILLTLLLVIGLASHAKAAAGKYEIPELGMGLTFPSKYDVLARDGEDNAAILRDYGMMEEDLQAAFEDGLYFCALDPQGEEEIVVRVTPGIYLNMDGMDSKELEALASDLEEEYTNQGIAVFYSEAYGRSRLPFISMDLYIREEGVEVLQYITIFNDSMVSIALRAYTQTATNDQVKAVRSVVDSLTISDDVPPAEKTPAFPYLDMRTGTSFTVPAGWTAVDKSEVPDDLDALFFWSGDPDKCIVYRSLDLGESDPKLYKSSEHLSGPAFRAEVAKALEIPEDAVTMEVYGEMGYYMARNPYAGQENGEPQTATLALHIENGWGYTFVYWGESGDSHYGDFESLLNSVSYGQIQASQAHGKETWQSLFERIAASFTAALILGLITFGISKIKSSLKSAKKEKQPEKTEFVYCQSCGKRFPAGTRVCDVCGEKIRKP